MGKLFIYLFIYLFIHLVLDLRGNVAIIKSL